MIVGIGVDIVTVSRIERIYKKYNETFARKILTKDELQLLPQKNPVLYLASRFAAKEALVKALETGFLHDITFQTMQIEKNELGAPSIRLFAAALDKANSLGVTNIKLSISHEKDSAIAFVVLEK